MLQYEGPRNRNESEDENLHIRYPKRRNYI